MIKTAIEQTRGVCSGKARIAGTRIPAWGLENARRLGLTVEQILESCPSVSAEQLAAAWDYAAEHPADGDPIAAVV